MHSRQARSERFRDPGGRLWHYSGRVLVRCPRCDGCATVSRPASGECCAVRVVCAGCGHAREATKPRRRFDDLSDPVLGLPLWLRAPCCGRTLRAYNAEHLAVLEGYVGASVRERTAPASAYTMVEILPLWMKLAKHRGEVLRVIDRLKRTLPG